MLPTVRSWRCWLVLGWFLAGPVCADESNPLAEWLRRPLLGTNVPLAEVQAFTEARVPRMPAVETARDWEKIAARLRREVLDQVVFRGEAARWRGQAVKVMWLDTLPGGPEYRIRKLRYEAAPGLWVPALLYEPRTRPGKLPVVLNVNGHDPEGKAAAYKQIRCINEAKRGMVALNPEWLGMGQLTGAGFDHYRMNQLDLCGTPGIAVFYLALTRALDVLLALPQADPQRVAVAGLSGGGWQTIFLSALDPRVTLANPVAGYSSFLTRARFVGDLGDSEQTPCDLATVADYTHLTALRAPRPTLLTFNAKDNCCFGSDHALAPLWEAALPIYRLYGQERRLRSHVNFEPGDHNFGLDNRQAFYGMLGDFFARAQAHFSASEIPSEAELKSAGELKVELPTVNANFNTLALQLSRPLPRQAKLPTTASAARRWQQQRRKELAQLVRARYVPARAQRVAAETNGSLTAVFWRLHVDDAWTLPLVELSRGETVGTALLIADAGRQGAAAEADRLLRQGRRVLALDPFYFGESKIPSRDFLFALLVSAVGERPLGIQASQLSAVARWAQVEYGAGPLTLTALGPRCSLMALVAAGLEERAIGRLELEGALASLKQVIEDNGSAEKTPELFCFGLLAAFDVKQLIALTAPRPVVVRSPTGRAQAELAGLASWYQLLGKNFDPLH